MKTLRYVIPFVCLLFVAPVAVADEGGQVERYAQKYMKQADAASRLRLANDFFAFLLGIDYIDEPIRFPDGSHIDSVDVNVYYYIAEWHYGQGDYQKAVGYLENATGCMGVVDDQSKSDVYALLGAAYFRLSDYDKAADALDRCYLLDKKSGDLDRMSSTLNSIASVFVAAGKPEAAEKYVLEAIAANSLTDNLSRRAVLYGTASELYRSMGDRQQSLSYAEKALSTERQTGDSARIGIRLSQLASAQMALSKVGDARRSLEAAIPLLHSSGNLHSWGICQNQLGDILASEGKDEEAAARYLEAARLFLGQGDMYNELHAREGLYKAMKGGDPGKAMLHLERAKMLKDSIYRSETAEALAKYNAIYYNDILQEQNEHIVRRNRTVLRAGGIFFALLLALVAIAVFVTYCRHRRKVKDYEQHISTIENQYSQINQKYQSVVADMVQGLTELTNDDKKFLQELTNTIYVLTEKGVTDIDTIARHMHINSVTLRRRLAQTLSITPKKYVMQTRMQKAMYLLQNYRDITIAEVTDRCAYAQVPNFTRAFKNFYGVMPTEVKTRTRKE